MKTRLLLITIIGMMLWVSVPVQAQNATQQELLTRINNLRAELGLAPYTLNSALNSAARSHAQWMALTSQVSHIQENGSSPQTRANASGYNSQWVSENIYMGGLASVDTAWNFWINSSIHYAGLTSTNYRDIGIGTAQGEGGRAYVLVFGVPSGALASSNASNGSSGGSGQASAPALPIVGYDEVGNIQYELQAGDTLGNILLTFGYTWDDLNTVMELNGFTEADITELDVGQVVLVPPPQGTYTPTPDAPEETTEPESAVDATEAVSAEIDNTATTEPSTQTVPDDGIIPTIAPTDNNTAIQPTATDDVIEAVGRPVTFVAVTASPTIQTTPSVIPTLAVNLPVSTAIAQAPSATPEPIIESNATPPTRSNPPIWLIGAIVIQVGVLGFASFEYWRRNRG